MATPHAANAAQAHLDLSAGAGEAAEADETAEAAEAGEAGEAGEAAEAEEADETDEAEEADEVTVEVSGRSRGGPSFGGARRFVLLGAPTDADARAIDALRRSLGPAPDAARFRKNPLAVLVSDAEVKGLGDDEAGDDATDDDAGSAEGARTFSVHVNFGNETMTSAHRSLLVDGSEGAFATRALERMEEALRRGGEGSPVFSAAPSDDGDDGARGLGALWTGGGGRDGARRAVARLLLELWYVGFLVRAA
jgi:hypothetical protein